MTIMTVSQLAELLKVGLRSGPVKAADILVERLADPAPLVFDKTLVGLLSLFSSESEATALRKALKYLDTDDARRHLVMALVDLRSGKQLEAIRRLARAKRCNPQLMHREAPNSLASLLPITLEAHLAGKPWLSPEPRMDTLALLLEGRADARTFFAGGCRASHVNVVLERTNPTIVDQVHSELQAVDCPTPFTVAELQRDFGHLLMAETESASQWGTALAAAAFEDIASRAPDQINSRMVAQYKDAISLSINDQLFTLLRKLQSLRAASAGDDINHVGLVMDRGITFQVVLETLQELRSPGKIWVSLPSMRPALREQFGDILRTATRKSHEEGISSTKASYPVRWHHGTSAAMGPDQDLTAVLGPKSAVLIAPFGVRNYGLIAESLAVAARRDRGLLLFDAAATVDSARETELIVQSQGHGARVGSISFADMGAAATDPGEVEMEMTSYSRVVGDCARSMGMSSSSLESYLRPAMARELTTGLSRLMKLAEGTERTFGRLDPAYAIVMSSRVPAIMVVLTAARRLGIPTVEPQAVLYGSGVARQLPPAADYIGVFDQYAYELFRDHYHVPTERLFVAGSIRIDGIRTDYLGIDREKARNRVSKLTSGATKAVLFATQPLPMKENLKALGCLLSSVGMDVGVIVKLHPVEGRSSMRTYKQFVADVGATDRCHVAIVEDTYELMAGCDVIVTMTSNVALEAAIFDLPVMIIDLGREQGPIDFEKMEVGLTARTVGQAKQILHDLLNNGRMSASLAKKRTKHRSHNTELFDGGSAERIIDFAEKAYRLEFAGLTPTLAN